MHVDMEDDVEEKNLCMYIQVQVHIVHLQVYFWHRKNMLKKVEKGSLYILLKLKH